MDENKRSSVSQATTYEGMGEFWDTHDFTEHDPGGPDESVAVRQSVAVEADLLTLIEQQASLRGVSLETLVNLWLQQRLAEETKAARA